MGDSMERLLESLFDYAGTFPPAKLDLRSALVEFERLSTSETLRRLCISGADLHLLPKDFPLTDVSVSVIGGPSTDSASWQDIRSREADAMNKASEKCPWLLIDAYEVVVPSFLTLDRTVSDFSGFQEADVYLELVPGPTLDDTLGFLADAEWPLAKVRTGGDQPLTVEALAHFLHSALAMEVPFKMTGGLHHLLYKTGHHGLLNVLGATTLGIAHDLTRAEICDVLTSDQASDWKFDEEGFSWCGLEASLDDIEDARSVFDAVGTCSVQETLDEVAAWAS